MANKIFTRSAWTSSEYAWTAHSYLSNARDLLKRRGQDTTEMDDLIKRVVEFANREEETDAEHALDVSCIVNAGAN